MALVKGNSNNNQQETKNTVHYSDREKEGLNGSVKQTKAAMFDAIEKDGEIYIIELQGYEAYFNSNMIKHFSEEGKLVEIARFNLKERRTKEGDFIKNDELKSGYYFTYDENGKETERTISKFNDDGELVERANYENGHLKDRVEYKYNEFNKTESVTNYNKDNAITDVTTFKYNKKNQTIEALQKDSEDNILSWTKYKRTAKGHTKESIELDTDGRVKNTTSYAHYFDASGEYKNASSPVKENNKLRMFHEKMEYDHHKNWVLKKVYYQNKVLVHVELREIDYYGEEHLKPFESIDAFLSKPFHISSSVLATAEKNRFVDIGYESFNAYKFSRTEDIQFAKLFKDLDNEWMAKIQPNNRSFSPIAYYALVNGFYPSEIDFKELEIDAMALLHLLMKMGGVIVEKDFDNFERGQRQIKNYTIGFPLSTKYLVHVSSIQSIDGDEYDIPDFIDDFQGDYEGFYPCHVKLYMPSSKIYEEVLDNIENWIIHCIQHARVYKKPNKPEIQMVEVDGSGNFLLQSHPVKDDFEIKELNLHYGQDFTTFHSELMNRFTQETQGLVLFHGKPGTGKTFYIRHLLRAMASANKKVIYMPPNMVDHLVDPEFMTFLSRTITQLSMDANFCVLLIEDAEPLLATRTADVRIQGVTNLLNMTDGLLNDVLKMQIICTFNVELKELDDALLRPGRLIARKEFKALPVIDANLLALSIGVDHTFTEPTTLSEIYAKLKQRHTILHGDE